MNKWILLAGMLLLPLTAFLQTITGLVKDGANSEALIGVNVVEKGTSNGTITDIDGKFELALTTQNATLVFSYIGYQDTEWLVNNQTECMISMNTSAAFLDEIVVVGYGVQKKSVVTGAISKLKSEDLEDMQVARLESALQGRTSGVRVTQNSGQPGSAAVVRVRGTTTLGNSDPLYVVDGIIISGGIDYLNQGDIESIEVLKDAASASIYGTRGANGVILVTTKKGKKGGMKVNYSGFYGTQRPWRKLALLDATEYATLMNEASLAAGQGVIFDNPRSFGAGTDWQDAVFRYDAPIQQHELSISGGNEKSTYFASFALLDQDGIVSAAQSNYKRYTARFNSEHKVSKRFTFGNTVAYTRVDGQGIAENTEFGSPLGRAVNLDPITPLYETNPDVLNSTVFTNFPVVRDENGVFGISNYVTSEILNPVAALQVQQGNGWSDKVVSNVFGEFEIFKGLKYRASAGGDLAFYGGRNFTPIFYLNAANRNDITRFNRTQNKGLHWIIENQLIYQNRFGDHDITFLIGASRDRAFGEGIGGTISNIPVDNIEDASLLFATPVETQAFYGFEYDSRVASTYSRLNYNYKEKYIFSGVLRRDGSSKFGKNNLYGTFPSVSAGWVISEESFMPTNKNINFLKLRASWGLNGNDRIGDFLFIPTVTTGSNYTFGADNNLTIGATPLILANPDLRWEETSQLNIGLDMVLFKNVKLTAEYFLKKTDGILQTFRIPDFVGFQSPIGNIGKIENEGFELELGYSKSVNDWNFDFSGNISYNDNIVTFIAPDRDFNPGQFFSPQGLEITRTSVGLPVGYFFGYKSNGLFQNQAEVDAYTNADGQKLQPNAAPGDIRFVDHNGDGVIDADDRTFIGDPTPKWTYGTNFRVDYKNFDLNIFGQGVFGNDVYRATRRFDLQMANLTADALGRWTGEGTSQHYPRLVMNDPNMNFSRSSDFYVESGAFFRIKNIQLGYTLPEKWAKVLSLGKTRFYGTVNNALTFTKYSGFDPEIGAGNGVDRGIYPQARSFIFGVNVTFL
jgi:TonB-linked SusC/RagA family outer membrane protein